MKRFYQLYIILAFMFISSNIIGQDNKIQIISLNKYDSVILNIPDYTGSVTWQHSNDGINWIAIPEATNNLEYKFMPDSSNFYRAQIDNSSCNNGYTNEIYIPVIDINAEILTDKDYDILMNQCYLALRIWHGKEFGYNFSEMGTDIFTYANQFPYKPLAQYDFSVLYDYDQKYDIATLTGDLWNEFYRGVLNCNAVINLIDNSGKSVAEKTQMKAEARFLRAYYYWFIVETWGSVLFTTENEPLNKSSFTIENIETFYDQIIEDLIWSEANLSEVNNDYVYITTEAVEAFLARIYLTRKMYNEAFNYASSVIESGIHSLLIDYDDIFYVHNERNSEILFAVNYNFDKDPLNHYSNIIYPEIDINAVRDGGSTGHLMFCLQYDGWPGMTRDVINGRPYRRYYPTSYLISCFNDTLDKRWEGSFKTSWISNRLVSQNWPVDLNGNDWAPDDSLLGKPIFNIGDTSCVMYKYDFPDSLEIEISSNYKIHKYKGHLIFDINDFYNSETDTSSINDEGSQYRNVGYQLKKFMDSTRTDLNSQISQKDVFVIRISEMYLIAAEALYYMSDLTQAYEYLTALANARAINGNGAELLSNYGVNDGSDINIDFILDERAREFAGEQLRWFDLKRTGKLVERLKLYNEDAKANIIESHNVRPIPLDYPYIIYKTDDLNQNQDY